MNANSIVVRQYSSQGEEDDENEKEAKKEDEGDKKEKIVLKAPAPA